MAVIWLFRFARWPKPRAAPMALPTRNPRGRRDHLSRTCAKGRFSVPFLGSGVQEKNPAVSEDMESALVAVSLGGSFVFRLEKCKTSEKNTSPQWVAI